MSKTKEPKTSPSKKKAPAQDQELGGDESRKLWVKPPKRVSGDQGRIVLSRQVPHPTKPGIEVEVSLRAPTESDQRDRD